METLTKELPLTFNKVFFLSGSKPTKKVTNHSGISYSADCNKDISNCVERGAAPLYGNEAYNSFWLGLKLCKNLELFDRLYPNSKFILIRKLRENNELTKIVLTHFCDESFAQKFTIQANIKYNDIVLSDIKDPESSKFIIFNQEADGNNKIFNFLSDSVIF
jgi:hypothetical protein